MVYPNRNTGSVRIILDGEDVIQDADDVHLCKCGIEFHSIKPMEEYKVVECQVNVPVSLNSPTEASVPSCPCGEIKCSGVVVDSRPSSDHPLYHISIFFLDQSKTVTDTIKNMVKNVNEL